VRGRPVSEPGPDLDPELLTWLVLRRAQRGRVVRTGGHYFDHGRPLPRHLAGTVDDLMAAGLLTLADPDPVTEVSRRIIATELGQARYAALNQGERAQRRLGQHPPCRRSSVPPADDRTF
jgi:hypothetical protein